LVARLLHALPNEFRRFHPLNVNHTLGRMVRRKMGVAHRRLDIPMPRSFFIGQIEVPEGTWIHPGETHDLIITFFNVRGLADNLSVGRVWRIQEGPKHVATAEVLSVLNNDNAGK
jgi:hypothetical protein